MNGEVIVLDLVRKKLNEVKPADYNPRKISKKDLEKLKNSIVAFGYVDRLFGIRERIIL